MIFIIGTGNCLVLKPPRYWYNSTPKKSDAAFATAIETPKIAFAPNLLLFLVPSKIIIVLSIATCSVTSIPIISGAITVASNLLVSNNTIFNGNTSINTNLNVCGNTTIIGNVTLGSALGNLQILGKIMTQLPEYSNNTSAIAAGVPLWGFYRTGGIIKICLSDVPPTLILTGLSSINITVNNSYTDPGVYAYSPVDGLLIPNLISISNITTTNIISNPIPIIGSSLITNTSTLVSGSYIITYSATDSCANSNSIIRNLIIS